MDGNGCVDSCVELLQMANVLTVRGNHDRWVLENKARHVPYAHHLEALSDSVIHYLTSLPVQLDFETALGRLLLCHGVAQHDLHKIWPGTARKSAERSQHLDTMISEGRFQLMINGHMHYRTLIHFHRLTLLNAGTIRGEYHPGFSVLDFDSRSVAAYEIHSAPRGCIERVKTLSLMPSPRTRVFNDTGCFDDQWDPVTLYA